MRPKTIVYFERIMFGILALGLIQSALGWRRATELASTTNVPSAIVPITMIVTFVLMTGLIVWISRYRGRVAAWILIIMTALGIPGFVTTVARGLLIGSGLITAIQLVGEIIALSLLFTPSARAWLGKREPQTLATTAATFD